MDAKDVFEEWTSYSLRRPLNLRDVDLEGMANLSRRRIVAVTGVRRSGKSSLLMLLARYLDGRGEKVGFISCEDSRLDPARTLEEALKWFGEDGYLILDEVTSAKDWEGWLFRAHEMLGGRLKVIVSSSRTGLMAPSKPLRGRIASIEVFPLTFKEFLRFKNIESEPTTTGRGKVEKALLEYLRYGGFPEVVRTEPDMAKVSLLNDYFRETLSLDVAEALGSNVPVVQLFGRYVLWSQTFSASKCLNHLKGLGYKIGKERILQLESYSQESYLLFFLPIMAHNIKDRSQYPREAYPVDPGLLCSVRGIEDKGRLLECIVFLQLRRNLRPGEGMFYWKDRTGREVDFIIAAGSDARKAVQACLDVSDPITMRREVEALSRCAMQLGIEEATMVTWDRSEEVEADGIKIHLRPVIDWLNEI
jgi:hypothetical protein